MFIGGKTVRRGDHDRDARFNSTLFGSLREFGNVQVPGTSTVYLYRRCTMYCTGVLMCRVLYTVHMYKFEARILNQYACTTIMINNQTLHYSVPSSSPTVYSVPKSVKWEINGIPQSQASRLVPQDVYVRSVVGCWA